MFQIQAWGFHIRKSIIAIMQNGILSFHKQRLGEETDVLVTITLFPKPQWQWIASISYHLWLVRGWNLVCKRGKYFTCPTNREIAYFVKDKPDDSCRWTKGPEDEKVTLCGEHCQSDPKWEHWGPPVKWRKLLKDNWQDVSVHILNEHLSSSLWPV